jgi:DnaJ-class molecular chaperone
MPFLSFKHNLLLLFLLLLLLISVTSEDTSWNYISNLLKALKNSNSIRSLRRAFRRAALEVHPDRASLLNTVSSDEGTSPSIDNTDVIKGASVRADSIHSSEKLSDESQIDINADVFIRLRAAYDFRRAELEGRTLPIGYSPFDEKWGQASTTTSSTNFDTSSSSTSTASASGGFSTGRDRCRAIKKARISSGVSWHASWTLLTSSSPQPATGESLAELNISLEMSFRGGSIPFTAHRVAKCNICKGSGVIINDTSIPEEEYLQHNSSLKTNCKTCNGSGFHIHGKCKKTKGIDKNVKQTWKNKTREFIEENEHEHEINNETLFSTTNTSTSENKDSNETNDYDDDYDDDKEEEIEFEKSFPGFGEAIYETCLDCCGTGKRLRDTSPTSHICSECSGSGNVLRFHKGHIDLPRGLISEDRLPIQGLFTPLESELASMKADGVSFSSSLPGSLQQQQIPQTVWYPSKLRIILDEEKEIAPFKLDPYPHLSRIVSLSLTHYCKLRKIFIRLPGTGPPPQPPMIVNGLLVPSEDTREVFKIDFPSKKTCFSGGGAGSLQHTLFGRGLPVSFLRVKKDTEGEEKSPSLIVGDFTLILQILFPDRVGKAQAELFSNCFGNESLSLIFSTADLIYELEKAHIKNEQEKYWFNYEEEWKK